MYSGVVLWSIANLLCNHEIHCHGFRRIDADLKSSETAWGKASHASAVPEEIASYESAARISTCKHRKCRRAVFVASLLHIRRATTPVLHQRVRKKKPAKPDGNIGSAAATRVAL
jgi:hypothetical protein